MDPSLGPLADFAGGIIRVEQSTSHFLNSNYPGESDRIDPEPGFRVMLRELGHVARMFRHPGVRRRKMRGTKRSWFTFLEMLGLTTYDKDAAFKNDSSRNNKSFTRYTLPALEFRMMLLEIRERRESFTIEYTQLTERSRDLKSQDELENWRASSCGKKIYHEERYENGKRITHCYMINTCKFGVLSTYIPHWIYDSSICSEDEIVMITKRPSLIASTLVLSNPYPILDIPGRPCGSSG